MTQEQKAKAYDKALERAKQVRKYSSDLAEIKRMEDIFPELEKSEDEKMIKDIMNCVESCYTDEYVQPIRAWLEKQVQKPAGWSEEDENRINRLIAYFEDKESFTAEDDIVYTNWLKSLKDRVQPKQEWSEEDEVGLCDAMWAIEQARTIAKDENDMGNLWYAERWLKSLKERYTWKPSKEQLKFLQHYADQNSYDGTVLTSLPNDLKKL